jgi:hypothetical protein
VAYFFVRNHLDFTRVDFLDPAFDFFIPGCLDTFVARFIVEAFQQRSSQSSTGFVEKTGDFFTQDDAFAPPNRARLTFRVRALQGVTCQAPLRSRQNAGAPANRPKT